MTTRPQVPPKPPTGEIVSNEVLYLQQFSTFRLASAFAGETNPSVIWQEMIRDSPQAILFYRELEEKDEDVAGALEDLKLSVLKRDRSVIPADDSSRAADIAADIDAQLKALPNFHASIESLLDAAGYGFALTELMWDYSMGQVQLSDVRDCPQELFLFAPRWYPQIGNLRFMQTTYDVDGSEVPEEKFAIFSYRPRSRNRRGRPLMRGVFWPSWFKRQMTRFWLRFGERGPGTAVTRYKDGADRDERNQALAAAEALISQVAMAVPETMEFEKELLQIARSQDPAVYEKLCDKMEMKIYRRINGQTLTSHGSDGGKGTQALGTVHENVQDTRGVELARAVQQVINQQIVSRLVLWNYGPDAPMPMLNFETSEAEDLAERITVDKTAQSMGYPITRSYMQERYDYPAEEAGDEVLVPQTGPATVQTAAGTPDRPAAPNFSEAEQGGKRDLAEFDALFTQLKNESLEIFRDRAKDIAEGTLALHPVRS